MISIIICSLGSNSLKRAISSVESQVLKNDEILIVSPYKLNIGSKCIYIKSKKGLASQRNEGLKRCNNDIVLFLDDDAYLQPESLLKLKQFYHKYNDAVGCELSVSNEVKDSTLSKLFSKVFDHTTNNGDGFFRPSGLPSFQKNSNHTTKVECLRGYMMSYNLSKMPTIEYFDTKFDNFWWGDDFEYSYRASKLGTLYKVHNSFVFHEGNSSLNLSQHHISKIIENYKYISSKHRISTLRSLWSILGFIVFKWILWGKKY